MQKVFYFILCISHLIIVSGFNFVLDPLIFNSAAVMPNTTFVDSNLHVDAVVFIIIEAKKFCEKNLSILTETQCGFALYIQFVQLITDDFINHGLDVNPCIFFINHLKKWTRHFILKNTLNWKRYKRSLYFNKISNVQRYFNYLESFVIYILETKAVLSIKHSDIVRIKS